MNAPSAVVVVESIFGNTRQIAEIVTAALEESKQLPGGIELVDAMAADPDAYAETTLLVVGGPTHVFGASRPASRKSVTEKWADIKVPDRGIREFMEALPEGHGNFVACFDTRIAKPKLLTGSASRFFNSQLRHKGYRVYQPSGSFLVSGTEGPLIDGETDRALAWASDLAAAAKELAASRV